jgi:FSR family fosmidomycin resistance protein-like MFS transporter
VTGRNATIIGLVSVAHGVSHFYQIIVAPLFPFIKEDLGVSYAALGFAMTLFYAASALCQPVAGFVVDRLGARNVLFGGLALMVAGIALVGLSGSYAVLVCGMLLAGIGNSVFHPADFTILNTRVEAARLGYAYSAHGMGGSIGYAAAPLFSASLGVAFGWHVALLAASGVGLVVLVVLLLNARRLDVPSHAKTHGNQAVSDDMRVLFSAPVMMCFLYFVIYCCALAGVQHFSVSAMTVQYGVSAAFASTALTSYMAGSAAGILAGGFIATRASRHDIVAMSGMAAGAACMLVIATAQVSGLFLPALFGLAGFSLGATGPSRDLIVRASTPPGATGRVYGFVYAGLDVGSLATPVLYGWLLDHGMPQGVFYVVFGFSLLAIFTVMQLPGRAPGRTSKAAAT